MGNNNAFEFDRAYEGFLKERDVIKHKADIETLLATVELNDIYREYLCKDDGIKDFFLSWELASKEEVEEKEIVGLKELGAKSKKLFYQKNYRELSEIFFNIAFQHLANFIHLDERNDFKELTDVDLYEKGLIPQEIFLQYFLLETIVKTKDFDWNRGEIIANQNLACLIICFSDLYEYFQEEKEYLYLRVFKFLKATLRLK